MRKIAYSLLLFIVLFSLDSSGQRVSPVMKRLPSLPDSLGFAGMFAGAIKKRIFCMGGANFPSGMPWQGGAKVWYDKIFTLENDRWVELKERLPFPVAYGVSASFKNKIILVGGNNMKLYSRKVLACSWKNNQFSIENYPDLPLPLANMAGSVVKGYLVITGGSSTQAGVPLNRCLALNLKNVKEGWFDLQSWPGSGRIFPVSASYKGKFYMFSGETTTRDVDGSNKRYILEDAYCLTLNSLKGKLETIWQKLPDLPKGISAAPGPAPFVKNTGFLFWGGVDKQTALHTDPVTHPGIDNAVIVFNPETLTWSFLKHKFQMPARVTAPVVLLKGQSLYISGEVKPGVRTNAVYMLK